MKKMLTGAAMLLMLGGTSFAEGWTTSWDTAVAESKATGKPILVDFTGSNWCGWCKKLKAEVFDKAEFKTWAKSHVVLLEADFPEPNNLAPALKAQNEKLSQKYAIEGYPTILFVNAAGEELGRYGYDEGGPAVWTKNAETKMAKK